MAIRLKPAPDGRLRDVAAVNENSVILYGLRNSRFWDDIRIIMINMDFPTGKFVHLCIRRVDQFKPASSSFFRIVAVELNRNIPI